MSEVMKEYLVNTSEDAPHGDYQILWHKQEAIREKERSRQARERLEDIRKKEKEQKLADDHQEKQYQKERSRSQKYGLMQGEFEAMQEWKPGCHNCGSLNGGNRMKWSIDHDHTCCPYNKSCGECIRGLLCSNCNIHEIAGIDAAVASGRLTPDCHPYLRDNWTHHREEWRRSNAIG